MNLLSSTPAVEKTLQMAKTRYERHLALYANLSLKRVLGKLMEFGDGLVQAMASREATEVTLIPAYSRTNARRVLVAYSSKELRRALEMVYQRVAKHFGETGLSMVQTVWRAIQDEFAREFVKYEECVGKAYGGTDVKLCFTVADAMACFAEITH